MVFYGTGGAEGIPSPYCQCGLCSYAREHKGKDYRRRSQFRLSQTHLIDYGPDTFAAAADWGDLTAVEHILITHTHEDHFHPGLIEARAYSDPAPAKPLRFYLPGKAAAAADVLRNSPLIYGGKLRQYEEKGWVAFCELEFGKEVDVGGLAVLPLRGNHPDYFGDYAANYFVTLPGGETLYYAVDTGWFLPETLTALRGKTIDILICECTWGTKEDRPEQPNNHLDIFSAARLTNRLAEENILTSDSRIYLTHINHKQQAAHLQMQAAAAAQNFPCRVVVGYDGMEVLKGGI